MSKSKISIFLLAIMLFTFILPITYVYADTDPVAGENRKIPTVEVKKDETTGIMNISIPEFDTVEKDEAGQEVTAWSKLFKEYRELIAGISGIGALTMIVFFIGQFMKLASSAGNPSARSQALTGVLWTGIAAVGLGAVSLVTGFFYNFL